jgi:gamma-glutamyl hercynylcysteine S-oxide synthase
MQLIEARNATVAISDLIRIVGWPSRFTEPGYLRKPVGCGAAFGKRALLSLFGSGQADDLQQRERAFVEDLRRDLSDRRPAPRRDRDVVVVPGGDFQRGDTPTAHDPFQMDDRDNPVETIRLAGFLIDRTAVSNARYAEFLDEIGTGGEFDHPEQPRNKSHVPDHWHDIRFNNPDHPVVGLDWYDAWAFAHWCGGSLPTEDQWEKAARGVGGLRFPWGDVFDGQRVHFVESAFATPVSDLQELEALLVTADMLSRPAITTVPVAAHALGASPYGALQMSGNVWEMTRTNYFSREDMDPFFRDRTPIEYMHREDAFHVIRGGAWSSPIPCLAGAFRGRDLISDRHCEIGFRVAYPE